MACAAGRSIRGHARGGIAALNVLDVRERQETLLHRHRLATADSQEPVPARPERVKVRIISLAIARPAHDRLVHVLVGGSDQVQRDVDAAAERREEVKRKRRQRRDAEDAHHRRQAHTVIGGLAHLDP